MDINFTARRFRAHSEIKEYAIEEVKKLQKLYDGIVRADIILFYERGVNSVKTAEIGLHVYGTKLLAHHGSNDYIKSIDNTVEKLGRQLSKYKSKLRGKDKTKVRRIQEKV
ncbi:MAG: ribosome-associated translation inhibitor RaiA [Bacteroidetes bacterium]|nr:ribosome-associated translation inhibitor RaiA [Bacteroidota bacterium]MCW5897381.1 ribosome-associated translation inhibitor RaiA [Bacteroidota bacterium]